MLIASHCWATMGKHFRTYWTAWLSVLGDSLFHHKVLTDAPFDSAGNIQILSIFHIFRSEWFCKISVIKWGPSRDSSLPTIWYCSRSTFRWTPSIHYRLLCHRKSLIRRWLNTDLRRWRISTSSIDVSLSVTEKFYSCKLFHFSKFLSCALLSSGFARLFGLRIGSVMYPCMEKSTHRC